jgi:hypothetical protein
MPPKIGPGKNRAKREHAGTLANTDGAPSVRAPVAGRRLGGGANGGLAHDDPDELRRVRLAALARHERKAAAAAAHAARKREAKAPNEVRAAAILAAATPAAAAAEARSRLGDAGAADTEAAASAGAAAAAAAVAAASAGAAAGAALSAAAAAGPSGLATCADLSVLAATVQLILRNARERPDRRTLKAANDGVWTKVRAGCFSPSFFNASYSQFIYQVFTIICWDCLLF